MLTGETADISEFAEFGWYDWIKFRNTVVVYPEDNLVLGRYLGPSTDIRPAMMAKILKSNGQYVHRTTLRGLTDEKVQARDEDESKLRKLFNNEIDRRLSPKAKKEDFEKDNIELTDPELYEDDKQAENYAPDREDIPDNAYNTYIGAELMLQKGDTVTAATESR